eukprot:gene487-494_t
MRLLGFYLSVACAMDESPMVNENEDLESSGESISFVTANDCIYHGQDGPGQFRPAQLVFRGSRDSDALKVVLAQKRLKRNNKSRFFGLPTSEHISIGKFLNTFCIHSSVTTDEGLVGTVVHVPTEEDDFYLVEVTITLRDTNFNNHIRLLERGLRGWTHELMWPPPNYERVRVKDYYYTLIGSSREATVLMENMFRTIDVWEKVWTIQCQLSHGNSRLVIDPAILKGFVQEATRKGQENETQMPSNKWATNKKLYTETLSVVLRPDVLELVKRSWMFFFQHGGYHPGVKTITQQLTEKCPEFFTGFSCYGETGKVTSVGKMKVGLLLLTCSFGPAVLLQGKKRKKKKAAEPSPEEMARSRKSEVAESRQLITDANTATQQFFDTVMGGLPLTEMHQILRSPFFDMNRKFDYVSLAKKKGRYDYTSIIKYNPEFYYPDSAPPIFFAFHRGRLDIAKLLIDWSDCSIRSLMVVLGRKWFTKDKTFVGEFTEGKARALKLTDPLHIFNCHFRNRIFSFLGPSLSMESTNNQGRNFVQELFYCAEQYHLDKQRWAIDLLLLIDSRSGFSFKEKVSVNKKQIKLFKSLC